MGTNIIYQKTDFGTFGQRNSSRSVFVDEKISKDVIAKEENEFDKAIKEIKDLISRFEDFIRRNKITEIRNKNDFLNAQYLKDPDYNFHEIFSRLNLRFRELFSGFIADVALILRRIEEGKRASDADVHAEILKISRLMGIARSIADEQLEIAKYNKKKSGEIVENLRIELRGQYKRIRNFRSSLASIQASEASIAEHRYALPVKLRFLSLMNPETSDRSVFIREDKLEKDISSILDEFEKTRQRYQQLMEAAGNEKEKYDLALKIFEFISWLKNNIINLLRLYLEHIQNTIHIETELEIDEIKKLSKVREYFNFLVYLPPLFRELFEADGYINKLKELLVNVSFYSEEGLKQNRILNDEVNELESALNKLDSSLYEEENLLEKIRDQSQQFDIIPRELNIPGPNGTIISGDIYLKDPDYKPKIGIVTLPGIAVSRKIYSASAMRAAQMGFLVYCADLPTQGHSVGEYRFGNSSENFLNVIRYLKKEYNLEKIGVIGYSLGSMTTLFTLMHFTKAIEQNMEKFDKLLIQLSKKNINYEKVFAEMIVPELASELKYYSEEIQNELKNIESKKNLLSREAETYKSIINYILRYEEFFNRELVVVDRLIKFLNYLEDEKIRAFKKYTSFSGFNAQLSNFIGDLTASLNKVKSYINEVKIPADLAEPLPREAEKAIVKSNFNRDINNLFSSCRNALGNAQKTRAKFKNELDGIIKKLLRIDPNDSRLTALRDYYAEELRLLIISDYEKFRDCKIDSLLLISPVDYPQNAFKLKPFQSFFNMIGKEEWFAPFVDVLFFILYREFARHRAETAPDKIIPVGSRFYFNKNAHIKGVRDKFEKSSLYKKMMQRLRLAAGEDPVQLGALKIWNKEDFIKSFLTPGQFQYLFLLKELYPEVLAEIESVPKMAVFGAEDRLIKFLAREVDLIKIFEELGNIRIFSLAGLDHDMDYGGNKHNLYVNPAFTKYVYDFFLSLANS